MGCAASFLCEEVSTINSIKPINKVASVEKIVADLPPEQRVAKILLLGAGECGKSTIVKQMKIIHQQGFDQWEQEWYRRLVMTNVTTGLTAILKQMEVRFKYENLSVVPIAHNYLNMNPKTMVTENGILKKEVSDQMKLIWSDPSVKKCAERGAEYGLIESTIYYLNALNRIADPNYWPTVQDILHSRSRTTGIIETKFSFKGLDIRMMDVGGQRSERKKWLHCFDDSTAVIFVASLTEYDMVLAEDPKMNRMKESIRVFGQIVNNRFLRGSATILFLNKSDLMATKLKKELSPLTLCFPYYKGDPFNYEQTTNYIKEQFCLQNKESEKIIYTHFTCATMTSNITFVFEAVTDVLIKENLRLVGLY